MSAEEFQGGISQKDEWSAYAKGDQQHGSQNAIHLPTTRPMDWKHVMKRNLPEPSEASAIIVACLNGNLAGRTTPGTKHLLDS